VFQKGVPQWAGKKAPFVSADRPGKATDLELASLKTWMAVEEAEQREEERRPIHPG
jgi:hypothetical protein